MLAVVALAGCKGPSIEAIQAKYPDRKIYKLAEGRIATNQPVGDLIVRWVDLGRTPSGSLSASVNYRSTSPTKVAPSVKVTLYDAKGTVLAEEMVVGHVMADLLPGETGNTSDVIPVPVNLQPVAFSLAPR
jgi:hypothetical protein